MNQLLDKLMAALKGTSGGTRVIVGLVALALAGVAGLAAVVVNKPHFELAFSGLTDHELAQVCKALSDAGIPFEQSQPPGPFVVYVDDANRSSAYMAAYGSGALDKPLEGILSDGGVASVFNSAEERAQGVRKREWQEMEKMLAELEFVASARVRTSAGSGSPLAGHTAVPPTASVTLHVRGGTELTREQSATVANLVSRGLGVAKSDLVISDQTGRSLYDGEARAEKGHEAEDMLAHQAEYDSRLAREANAVLEQVLGPNKAHVTVSSEWDFAQTTQHKETSEKGAVVQETKTTSEKPVGSTGAASVAGLSSNTLDPGDPGAPTPGSTPASSLLEKTSEEKKQYSPTISREERVRFVPELKRLSVALFLDDQSVQAGQVQKLEEAIKAAVGFDEERRDSFTSVTLPFVAAPEVPVDESAAVETPSQPNPLVEMLLRHGIEVASAAIFLVMLLKTLKGSRGAPGESSDGSTEEGQVDPELLARAQIDELLKSDPSKVGEILSRWAREEPVASR